MKNPERTANYLRQNIPALRQGWTSSDGVFVDPSVEVLNTVTVEYIASKLTPKQRRRIQHKRAPEGVHRQRQRERRQTQLMIKVARQTEELLHPRSTQ